MPRPKKLTDAQKEQIRQLLIASVPHRKIAKLFHVSSVTVTKISTGMRAEK